MLKSKLQTSALFLILSGFILTGSCTKLDQPHRVVSPDKDIVLNFKLEEGKPVYSIFYKNKPVILPSGLGIRFGDGTDLGYDFQLVDAVEKSEDESWKPVWGIHETYQNKYNELSVTLGKTGSPDVQMILIFRVYDDGAAFRYHIPEQSGLSGFTIISENTQIIFTGDHKSFVHLAERPGLYQNEHTSLTLSEIPPGSIISPPMTVEADQCWVSIMEADLAGYAGMSLAMDTLDRLSLSSRLDLTGLQDRTEVPVPVMGAPPFDTPWRVFMIGDQAGDFIESPLVYNLNDPCALDDVSWIKPGKVTWPWWNDRVVVVDSIIKTNKVPAPHDLSTGDPSTEVQKHFIDFAARNGIPYLLVCAGWYGLEGDVWARPWEENVLTMEETREEYYDIHEVIDYAGRKGVDVWLWVHLGSIMTKERVDTVLETLARWGAKGIKPDYYEGEDQDLVRHFQYVLEVAAENKLMVDYHGSYKPTGESRTYPHYMSNEAVHGLECSKWGDTPKPEHNVIIPYTRMLCGPMDYTPGAFDLDGAEGFPKQVQTTRAQQLAMYPVYFTPLQMLVDYPYAYESAPGEFEFLKQVPTTWDETRFLAGYPGEYVAVARKRGNDWFVGVMNNEEPGREIRLSLDFLEPGRAYSAHVFRDAPDADQNPENVIVEEIPLRYGQEHKIVMASGGGAAIWFEAR